MTELDIHKLQTRLGEQHSRSRDFLGHLATAARGGYDEYLVGQTQDALLAVVCAASDAAQAIALWRQEAIVRPGESRCKTKTEALTKLSWKGQSVLGLASPVRSVRGCGLVNGEPTEFADVIREGDPDPPIDSDDK